MRKISLHEQRQYGTQHTNTPASTVREENRPAEDGGIKRKGSLLPWREIFAEKKDCETKTEILKETWILFVC